MRCGLLGEHLQHSYSPQIHALLGSYSYALFEVQRQDLDAFLRGDNFDALNVTIPYKRAVLPYCAELSTIAHRTGSVNTLLRRRDGSLYGDNTDYEGFRWLLARSGGIARGDKALVLGNGGASQTVQLLLRELGANVTVLSRQGEHNYDTLSQHADARLLVNTTPVGMYPSNGACLVDLSALKKCACVLDLIYNPVRTQLILDAEAHGIRCEGGLPMLVAQAVRAAELFTDTQLPERLREEVLRKMQSQMLNIVLIGMPGCGKSAVGAALAAQTGRTFFDADVLLEEKAGCTIPEFFTRHGEDKFRALETQVLRDLGARSACVIATGGGCVTREENYRLLHQNGTIIWLQRDITQLPKDGRPISQRIDLQTLYNTRRPLYEKFADQVIGNGGSVQDSVVAIINIM